MKKLKKNGTPVQSTYAKVEWVPDDILTLRPNMTREQAEEWLEENEEFISERCIERGWEVISSLLDFSEQAK
jgi:hypothetical protein